jgi:hypothetical protein
MPAQEQKRRNEFCIRAETKHGKVLTIYRGFSSEMEAEDYPVQLSLWKRVWVERSVAPAPPPKETPKFSHEDRLNQCFDDIVRAALRGERCPENNTQQVNTARCRQLAAAGRIKIEVYARNFRVVTLLTGPHAGKKTAPPPYKVQKPKLVITKDGKRIFRMFSRQPKAIQRSLQTATGA